MRLKLRIQCRDDGRRNTQSLTAADDRPLKRFQFDPLALGQRSEEHTSELQSRTNLVCRLLLEKKKACKS